MTRMTVYFTSDLHGFLYPTDFITDDPRPMGLLSMCFPKDGNTLIIDGGDTIQGSPLTYFCHEEGLPTPMADPMNDRAYDYVTLGNHDFNYGPSWLADHLTRLNTPCLCANVHDETGLLSLRPWTVHTLENGLRVGLFGLVTQWVNRWEKPENLVGLTVSDPVAAGEEAVRALQAQNVDQIVCIYHGGLEKDPDTGRIISETDEHLACLLCERLPIDLMLTGHQHTAMADKRWAGTHIVQTPCNGTKYIRVTLDDKGEYHSELLTPALNMERTAEQAALWEKLDRFLDRPAGTLPHPLRPEGKLRMAFSGSDIADFINQVQLWASGAEVSCQALPNEIRGFAQHVTIRDVLASYPYSNTLTVRSVTGKVLRQGLEQCARYFDRDENGILRISDEFLLPKESHYYYDYFAGIEYTFDLSRPAGNRVTRLEKDGRSIVDDDTLTLCMTDYRATGAGHFDFYCSLPVVREIQTEVSELILNYLKAFPCPELPARRAYQVIGGELPQDC